MDFMLEEEMLDLLTFCLQNPTSDELESKNACIVFLMVSTSIGSPIIFA